MRPHLTSIPPSTAHDAPVTYAAAGEASIATTAATSRASPGRPTGTPGRCCVNGSTSSCPVIGVAISPGATALTVIPSAASSCAITFVSSPSPPFAAQYADEPTRGACSCTLVMLMIRPPRPAARIRRAARCEHRNGPSRSTASTSRHFAQLTSTNGSDRPVPALLTSTPRPPSRSASSSMTAAASGSRVRSSSASATAHALPMPESAPVTIATRS